jgi:alpha-D-ribose 1-methylphosphonate 5-triphosphate diphosphatase PhnM
MDAVIMGAPNVVRGGSHLGWASAAPLAERGLVNVLASDYFWPAMVEAAFIMAARGVVAHAIDEEAARFYEAHGFVRSPLGERVMLMPIETVRGVVGG